MSGRASSPPTPPATHRQLGLYLTLAPEEKTLYAVGGPKAQAEFDAGLQGFATRAFRGLGVVMSEPVRAQKPLTRACAPHLEECRSMHSGRARQCSWEHSDDYCL